MFRGRARYPVLRPGVMEDAAGVVEHLADLGSAGGERGAGRVDVAGEQLQALRGTGPRGGYSGAEDDGAREPDGVSCTTRKSGPEEKSASSRQPSPW